MAGIQGDWDDVQVVIDKYFRDNNLGPAPQATPEMIAGDNWHPQVWFNQVMRDNPGGGAGDDGGFFDDIFGGVLDDVQKDQIRKALIAEHGDMVAAQILAGGQRDIAMWKAIEENPQLLAQLQHQGRQSSGNPHWDIFAEAWYGFPDEMARIGDIIGSQLNRNADRIHETNLARGRAETQKDIVDRIMSGIEGIGEGCAGAFSGGVGSGQGPFQGFASPFNAGQIMPDGTFNTMVQGQGNAPGVIGRNDVDFDVNIPGAEGAQGLDQFVKMGQNEIGGEFERAFDQKAGENVRAAEQANTGMVAGANVDTLKNLGTADRNNISNFLRDMSARSTAGTGARAANTELMNRVMSIFG